MREIPYRLLGTATAAPNDYLELGTSSEALGELGYMDMLGRFFKSESGTSTHRPMGGKGKSSASKSAAGNYRFKGHAQEPFWRWVSSWARAIRKPSDYGYDDGGFILPALIERSHIVESVTPKVGTLFDVPATGLHEEREEARRTLNERCEKAAELLTDSGAGVAWCHLNDESSRLASLIDGAVELTGSASPEEKEEKLLAFSHGEVRVLVTKPVIGAWGLNWQHAHKMTYFPSHSYEQYYQSVRRMWRFGQRHEVVVDVVTTKGGQNVLNNLHRKSKAADAMFTALIGHMNDALRIDRKHDYTDRIEVPSWLA
ncbi:MAG: helicase C-terminal domain-containing protein, partial [Dermatophilaceae bacterium]